MTDSILTSIGEKLVHATQQQIDAIEVLTATRKGGCASVVGYRPANKWEPDARPVQNIQFLSRTSTAKLYERKMKTLEAISFADVRDAIDSDPKLSKLSDTLLLETFQARLGKEFKSMAKTLDGDRSDAHRQGHDRCYIHISEGIKVNLETHKSEKDADGKTHQIPVLTNGNPTVKSIMVSALYLNVNTTTEGTRKYPKSGPDVLMSNAIQRYINKNTLQIKMISLKPDNFQSLTIDKNVLLPSDIADVANVTA